MKNFIFSLILISSPAVFASDLAEEGLVLNQELQFLQESAKAPAVVAATQPKVTTRNPKAKVDSLERMYFEEDSEEDTITTKAAGRRRRGTD